MYGIAESLFEEKMGKRLLPESKSYTMPFPFPLEPTVYTFTQNFWKNHPEIGIEGAAFLSFLFKASLEGHLAVSIGEEIEPAPTPIPDEIIKQGALLLPETLLTTRAERAGNVTTPFCKYGNFYYLQRNWEDETLFLTHYKRLKASIPSITLPFAPLEGLSLEEGQKEAIQLALQRSLTLITGGPGTGKTYTAGHLIRLLLNTCPTLKVALAAPTGKAASTLQASIQLPDLRAQTLHSLLKKEKLLEYDLILVDESSMIDVSMMASLFSKVKDGARLILMGDPHQLPPIEAGALFKDLPPTLTLSQTKRTDDRALQHLAKSLLEETPEKIASMIILKPLDEDLTDFPNTCLLTPLRKGPFGVEALNAKLKAYHEEKERGQEITKTPIMIVQNDSTRDVYNGDLGLLYRNHRTGEEWSEFGNRKIPPPLLPRWELAYCLSVHKSQGSEFDHVRLLLPEGSEKFGREMIYTAVTRARKTIEILGTKQTLLKTLALTSSRLSGLTLYTKMK